MENFEHEIRSLTLIPADGGRFEVVLNDTLVYSKLQTKRHAEAGEVVDGPDVGWVGHDGLSLLEVVLDVLGLAEEERALVGGTLHESTEHLHGFLEFLREFRMFLVLPGVAEGGESGLKGGE